MNVDSFTVQHVGPNDLSLYKYTFHHQFVTVQHVHQHLHVGPNDLSLYKYTFHHQFVTVHYLMLEK
jgi:coproporphyrinogen III oxidase-like Fe-S oxidoreductase